MVDRRRKLHRELAEELPGSRKTMASTWVPAASAVEQMGVHRSPIVQWAPRTPAAVAYADLWQEARRRLR